MNEIGKGIDEIENSDLSKELKINLEGKFEGLPNDIKKILISVETGSKTVSQGILSNVYGAGKDMTFKLSNFSGSTVHSVVLKIGHTIGYKFKPWEAIKFTKRMSNKGFFTCLNTM